MSTKLNVPSTYFWEAGKYRELEFVTKTSSGAYNETSTTSLVVYSGNDGTQGLFNKLGIALANYIITASDFNNKWDYPNTQTKQTPPITFGQNLITNTDIADAYPDITFQGQSYVNLLGADGNCEDVSKWNPYQCTLTLDTSKKVFGANAIKLTSTASGMSVYRQVSTFNLDVTKYYLFSAYAAKGTAPSAPFSKDALGGGVYIEATTANTDMTRLAFKAKPSDLNSTNNISVSGAASVGQTMYMDGIMVNEISATEYANDSVDVLMARYPYIDSYACLQNPAVEVVKDNMVRNGNGEEGVAWWNNTGALVNVSSTGVFQLTTTDAGHTLHQVIKVKPNTDYQLKCVCSGSGTPAIRILSVDLSTVLINTSTGGTFNSGALTEISMYMQDLTTGSHVNNFSEIHLIPGTVAPTAYKPQRREQCVIEGKFATGDTVSLKEGKLEGTIGWEHKTLYGRDWAFTYVSDAAGYKLVQLPSSNLSGILGGVTSAHLVKHDGAVLKAIASIVAGDTYLAQGGAGSLYISLFDTDTGWAESIAPNADEVKAYMNGWKANANNGTRYTSWVSVVDGSAPATNTIAYVSITVAPLYKGYRISYQLANPKAVNSYNTRLKGTLPKLESGINVVNVDAGLVVGEVANPVYDGSTRYLINAQSTTAIAASLLNQALESFIATYRNKMYDASFSVTNAFLKPRGNAQELVLTANFDPKAQYTVDYIILRTQAPVVGTPSMEYLPGVTKKVQPQFQNDPKIWQLPSAPSNDFGYDGDGCIYPGGFKTKAKGQWV